MKKENKTALKYLLLIVVFTIVATILLIHLDWDILAIFFAVPTFVISAVTLLIKIPNYTPPKKKTPEQVAREVWAALF